VKGKGQETGDRNQDAEDRKIRRSEGKKIKGQGIGKRGRNQKTEVRDQRSESRK